MSPHQLRRLQADASGEGNEGNRRTPVGQWALIGVVLGLAVLSKLSGLALLVMAAIVIATIWWSLGIAMILFLAGLQDINKEIYEAAAIDDATGVTAFWHLTLPLLKRTI